MRRALAVPRPARLSDREVEVLRLIARGCSDRRWARRERDRSVRSLDDEAADIAAAVDAVADATGRPADMIG